MIVVVAAKAKNRTMGLNGAIPWQGDMPADVKRFRDLTEGKTMIMGLNTFNEFDEPMPGRLHVVVSPDPGDDTEFVKYVDSIDKALTYDKDDDEVFVIGGASILDQTKDTWEKVYLTEIHEEFEGDAFFPEIDMSQWKEEKREEFQPDAENKYAYGFVDLVRI